MNSAGRKGRVRISLVLLLCAVAVLPWIAVGQDTGEMVVKRGNFSDDLYAAARSVDIDATVNGDVVAAGGQVAVSGTVRGDALLAGGNVALKGQVDDDVRAAGGSLAFDVHVGDDLLAAGGEIRTSSATRVGGHAWFAGGTLDLAGQFAQDLRAAAGEIRLSGHVHGNVDLTATTITILPGTVIDGNLVYRSRHVANLDKDVIVHGTVTRAPYPGAGREEVSLGAWPAIVFYVALFLSALFLALVFARFSSAAMERLRTRPWAALGLGFAVLVVTPAAALVALVLVLTFLPGLVLLALYPVALLTGLLLGLVWLGEWGARLIRRDAGISPGYRALSLLAAVVVLALIDLVPVLGGLTWFLLTLFGLGAGALQLSRQYAAST